MRKAPSLAILAFTMFLAGCETENSTTAKNSNNFGAAAPAPDDESCALPTVALDGGTLEIPDCGTASDADRVSAADATPHDLYLRSTKQ